MTTDFAAPLTKRLKRLARDSQNVAMNVLSIFTGAKKISKSREGFSAELTRLIEQVGTTAAAWAELEELLFYLESKAGEVNELELIKVVEGAADSAVLAAGLGDVWRQTYVECALRMLKLDSELIPYAIKELKSHDAEQAELWRSGFNG